MNANVFIVDFYAKPKGSNGRGMRQRIQGSSMINLGNSDARSDFAVQRYLQNKYPNQEIDILNVEWREN